MHGKIDTEICCPKFKTFNVAAGIGGLLKDLARCGKFLNHPKDLLTFLK